ncbi:hypothetical protein HOK021_43350 [Streptomyces hygroscopicus]|nr:hypothetical protein HOK021_43350 [Streptomyces hygroscopicus]
MGRRLGEGWARYATGAECDHWKAPEYPTWPGWATKSRPILTTSGVNETAGAGSAPMGGPMGLLSLGIGRNAPL